MINSLVTLLITYNSHPWIMFSFNWLGLSFGEKGERGGGRELRTYIDREWES